MFCPYPPLYIENNIPFYCSLDIDIFGLPHLFGIENYHVVLKKESEQPLVLDYELEQYYFQESRKIHHYDRIARFNKIIIELGGNSTIKLEILNEIYLYDINPHPEKTWASIKKILKFLKKPKLYNRIPYIVKMFGGGNMIIASMIIWRKVTDTFIEMSKHWDLEKNSLHFPPLRYIALKLLGLHNAKFMYYIPLVLTKRKKKKLDLQFLNLLGHIS